MQKKLLIMTDWFCPGYKAGGTISSCYNLVMLLKNDYSIYILTSDRDIGDQSSYEKVMLNEWSVFCENVQIFYASRKQLGWRPILRQIQQLSPDCIYLNSMYSLYFTIYPLLQKRMGLLTTHIVLSPSGMLKTSALMQKPLKKKYFLKVFRFLNIHHQFTFHAIDGTESREITHIFGKGPVIHQVYYAPPAAEERIILPAKIKGTVNLIFIGRVHPVKNLHFLLECLNRTTHTINITIIGPVEDKTYYDRCRQLEQGLRENIKLHYTGGIPNEAIKSHLREHHFLVHPSLGENFGYSIVEAFCQGRPAIISDRTPWKNMEAQKTGMDIPLDDHRPFIDAINKAANMEQEEYHKWCEAAWNFARFSLKRAAYKDQYIEMFTQYKEQE